MRGNANRSFTLRMRAVLSAAVVVCAVTAVLPGAAVAGTAGVSTVGVERISVAPDGTQGDGDSVGASITPDGRHVVFSSSALNLAPGTTTGGDKAFVRDRQTGQTQQIGHLSLLAPPVISGDGRYAAYPVPWFNNVRIRQYKLSTGGTASTNCLAYSCDQPDFSTTGRYIALAVRQPSVGQRVEVHDDSTGVRETVATLGHAQAPKPSLSGDARYVAYQDAATQDVFVRDRTAGTTTGPVEGPSVAAALVQLSDDGSKVVYLSGTDTYVHDVAAGTAQLVPNVKGVAIDPTGRYLLYAPTGTTGPSLTLRDLQTGTDEIVSDQPASARTDAVSTGGREVVFHSAATDIVPGDTNGKSDLFVRTLY